MRPHDDLRNHAGTLTFALVPFPAVGENLPVTRTQSPPPLVLVVAVDVKLHSTGGETSLSALALASIAASDASASGGRVMFRRVSSSARISVAASCKLAFTASNLACRSGIISSNCFLIPINPRIVRACPNTRQKIKNFATLHRMM